MRARQLTGNLIQRTRLPGHAIERAHRALC
jgi:hypothetical protein